ncbi:MAG TPA: hemolysin III family protein [Stellaceae bacterium]|nr:hemolysin III family protein [Stellaceae bacterium]
MSAARSVISWPKRIDGSILVATFAFSLGAMGLLAYFAIESADRRQALAILVYGATLVACSFCSFLYNSFAWVRCRPILRYLDHAAIFLLIAGTYTPFAGGELRGPLGFSVLQWVWALAGLGVALKLLLFGAYDRLFVAVYLAIGWFIVTAGREALAAIAAPALLLLVIGGIVYTVGAIIFARDRGRWTAPVWHSCVLAGSLAHFLAVIALVITTPGA